MNQELLDLYLGELPEERAGELRARLRDDAALQSEWAELEALFGFMRQGEEIESDPSIRRVVMAEARHATAPSLFERLRALPALVGYRFRHSRVFRIAAVSLGVHLLAMGVLYQFVVRERPEAQPYEVQVGAVDAPEAEIRPDATFVQHLRLARASRPARLRRFGVAGQARAIREGIESLVARQGEQGAWDGELERTSQAALVLMAEGVQPGDITRRGQSLRAAMRFVRGRVIGGESSPSALEALVEDWALNHEHLSEPQRAQSVDGIRALLLKGGNGDGGVQAALHAGFAPLVTEPHEARDLGTLPDGAFVRDAFRNALRPARDGDPVALLKLQSPYRA